MVLGIVGGGQLALYLCQAAQELGFKVAIFADSADAPALQRADRPFSSITGGVPAFSQFLASCDVITFDKEAVGDDMLAVLIEESRRSSFSIYPAVGILHTLKDKGLQKAWLREQGLPTLPFRIIAGRPDALAELTQELGPSVVQKSRVGGYDGRGVQILQSVASLEHLWDVPSVVEPFLPDCQEISVITVRARNGELQTYPPVKMEFDPQLNSVRIVSMPANIGSDLCVLATQLAERAVTLLQGVGVFAIEMFITPDGDLFINEISPRVHNSGHLTQDACNVSQFEQHVRAVMGLPLIRIEQTSPAAMCNILYTQAMEAYCPEGPVTERLKDVKAAVYWYGKATGSTGRKMGHINAVAATVSEAELVAQRVLAEVTSTHTRCLA